MTKGFKCAGRRAKERGIHSIRISIAKNRHCKEAKGFIAFINMFPQRYTEGH